MSASLPGSLNPMFKHGKCYTREYRIWARMKDRCLCKTNDSYARYGARGIKVCDRWMDFELFLQDMGPCPVGFSIERRDNDGDYEPNNCSWIPIGEQSENRSQTVWLTYGGQTQSLGKWAKDMGISKSVIHWRSKAGWTAEKILTTPSRKLTQEWRRNG